MVYAISYELRKDRMDALRKELRSRCRFAS